MEDTAFTYGPDADRDGALSAREVEGLAESFEDVPVDSMEPDSQEQSVLGPDTGDEPSMDVETGSGMVAMLGCVQSLGVAPEHAVRFASSIVREKPATFVEAYSQGNMVREAS